MKGIKILPAHLQCDFKAFICFAISQLPPILDSAVFSASAVSCPGFRANLPRTARAKTCFSCCLLFNGEQMLTLSKESSQTGSSEPSGRWWLNEKPGYNFRVFKNAEFSSL